MKKHKSKHDLFEERLVERTMEVKNPIRTSIVILLFQELFCLVFVIAISFINDAKLSWNINIGFTIALVLNAIWAFLRIGVLESFLLKAKNWSNSKLVKSLGLKKDISLTLDQYRKIGKKKSFVGLIIGFSVNAIGFVISLSVFYM